MQRRVTEPYAQCHEAGGRGSAAPHHTSTTGTATSPRAERGVSRIRGAQSMIGSTHITSWCIRRLLVSGWPRSRRRRLLAQRMCASWQLADGYSYIIIIRHSYIFTHMPHRCVHTQKHKIVDIHIVDFVSTLCFVCFFALKSGEHINSRECLGCVCNVAGRLQKNVVRVFVTLRNH